jgi:hypothetical protein
MAHGLIGGPLRCSPGRRKRPVELATASLRKIGNFLPNRLAFDIVFQKSRQVGLAAGAIAAKSGERLVNRAASH